MVLRTKFDNGLENYTSLGDEYVFVDNESAKEEFLETGKSHYGKNWPEWQHECYGFIVYNNGSKTRPLYRGQENCILNDKGELFDKLFVDFKKREPKTPEDNLHPVFAEALKPFTKHI